MSPSRWYVITGGPSCGKTTVLHELKKQGQIVFEEAARQVIDEGRAMGRTLEEIRGDEKQFQDLVLKCKIAVEETHDKATQTFFDRGVHDTLAYYEFYGWNISPELRESSGKSTYQAVFLLDPLPFFEQDYARTEDKEFAQKLHRLLQKAYSDAGLTVVHVPVLSPKERAQFILDYIVKSLGGRS